MEEEAQIQTKITAAVADCLALCKGSPTPYTCVSRFVSGLQADPAWPDKQIIKVQTEVINVLLWQERNRAIG